MKKTICVNVLVVLSAWSSIGCSDRSEDVIGVVGTVPGLAESCISTRVGLRKELGEKPIPQAIVYLAYDPNGLRKVKGFETRTGADGQYRLQTSKLSRSSENQTGVYYLVVKKQGFLPLSEEINPGAYSHFVRNSVFLKPTGKHERQDVPLVDGKHQRRLGQTNGQK
jgi:hypothetical protein